MPTTAFCWESKKHIRCQTYKEVSEIIFQPCLSEQINLILVTLAWLPEFKFSGIAFNTTHRPETLPVPLTLWVSIHLCYDLSLHCPFGLLPKGNLYVFFTLSFLNAQLFRGVLVLLERRRLVLHVIPVLSLNPALTENV